MDYYGPYVSLSCKFLQMQTTPPAPPPQKPSGSPEHRQEILVRLGGCYSSYCSTKTRLTEIESIKIRYFPYQSKTKPKEMVKKTYKAQGRPDCMIRKPCAPACSVTQWGNASPAGQGRAGSRGPPRCSLGWPSTTLGPAALGYLLRLALSSASDQSLWWQSTSKLSPAPGGPVEV